MVTHCLSVLSHLGFAGGRGGELLLSGGNKVMKG